MPFRERCLTYLAFNFLSSRTIFTVILPFIVFVPASVITHWCLDVEDARIEKRIYWHALGLCNKVNLLS